MKYFILIITILCTITISNAQVIDTTNKKLNNEIGVDATLFVKNILDFGQDYNYYSNDYLLSYKRIIKNKAIRFSLGGMYSTRQDTGGYSSNTDFKDKTQYFNAKLGFEFRNQFSGKWLFYYGADFISGYNHNVSHNMGTSYGRPDKVSNTVIYGGGPVIGFELILNSRLSISTESSIYFLNSKQDVEYLYEDTPEHNIQALHKSSVTDLNLPLSIFIKYKF